MPLYYVDVLWGTKLGNPTATRARVHATGHEAAMAYLRERVRKYKRCGKIHGGSAIEVKPNGPPIPPRDIVSP